MSCRRAHEVDPMGLARYLALGKPSGSELAPETKQDLSPF